MKTKLTKAQPAPLLAGVPRIAYDYDRHFVHEGWRIGADRGHCERMITALTCLGLRPDAWDVAHPADGGTVYLVWWRRKLDRPTLALVERAWKDTSPSSADGR